MDPAQGDEVVLVLYVKEFLFVQGFTGVRTSLLFRENDVRHHEYVVGLCVCVCVCVCDVGVCICKVCACVCVCAHTLL